MWALPIPVGWAAQCVLAEQAALQGKVPVGALVVRNGIVVGMGQDRPVSTRRPAVNAEMVALDETARPAGNYSAPLVLLTDAFAGEFLCFSKLGWGHSLGKSISQLCTFLIPIRRSDIRPHMGIETVLWNPFSLGVHHTQISLGTRNPLLGSKG